MVKRLTMVIAGLFLFIGAALAQSQVSGTVVDDNGEPVIGAAVRVAGTKTGTVTDVDGKFSIPAPANSRLEISYIGMKSRTVKAGQNMKITMEPDNNQLDEVMVVAYGKQTKASFTGSAAVVNSKDLNKKIATNVSDALVGSVPGLQMTGASGQPGADNGGLHIRGIASMYANTNPLIIVDGAPYSASLSNLPQDDIASVTVLKDAASAALYGARGAAGVILITTKSGDSQKSVINLEAKFGGTSRSVQDYDTFTDPGAYLEAYGSQFFNNAFYKQGMSREEAMKWANAKLIDDSDTGLRYNPYTVPKGEALLGLDGKLNPHATLGHIFNVNGTNYYMIPDDWKSEAYRHGFRQEYNLNISGGGKKVNYYSSLGYLDETGVLYNSGYNRLTARLKADYKANNWLRMYANVGYVHSKMESNPNLSNTSLSGGNMGYFTQYIAPIYPLYVRTVGADGQPQIATDKFGLPKYDFGTGYVVPRPFSQSSNPVGANHYNEVVTYRDQLQGQFNFDINFTSWLKFMSTNSLNVDVSRFSHYENPYIGPSASENGRLEKYTEVSYRTNFVQTLNFHKLFGKHDVQAMLGHEWYKRTRYYLESDGRGGFSPAIKELAAFSNIYDGTSWSTAYNVEGYFGNAMYNYAQRYFAQASYRRDASSNFAKNHRWGNFWSVGGAWIITKENFFKNLDLNWVDNLKLKVSVGQQGNDGIPSFEYVDRYGLTKGENIMLPSFDQIGNPSITWETTTNFNIGLEFGLFHNRLNGEFNFYNKTTKDMLFWLSVPESMGVRGYYGNIGDIRNRGIELTLSGEVIRTKNIDWSVSANISHNRTKTLKLDPNKTKQYGGFTNTDVGHGFNVTMWHQVGKPLFNAILADYAGVNEKGLPLYWVDKALYEKYTTGQMSNTSMPGTEHSFTTTDWTKATRYEHELLPFANGGFSTSLRVYDFDLTATFDYQIGGKIYDFGYSSLMDPITSNTGGQTLHKDVLKSWTPDNTSTNIPRFMYGDLNTTSQSTRFLTSAKYLNFQSFVVGYTLPSSWTKKALMNKVRVYVQGQNLWFWTARKGLDPRFSFQGTTSAGVNSYAPVRTIMGGIQVSF